MTCAFLLRKNILVSYRNLKLSNIEKFGKDFKGAVVNQALTTLRGGSLEIRLTVPLKRRIKNPVSVENCFHISPYWTVYRTVYGIYVINGFKGLYLNSRLYRTWVGF